MHGHLQKRAFDGKHRSSSSAEKPCSGRPGFASDFFQPRHGEPQGPPVIDQAIEIQLVISMQPNIAVNPPKFSPSRPDSYVPLMCKSFTFQARCLAGAAEFCPKNPQIRAFFPESHHFTRPAHVAPMCTLGRRTPADPPTSSTTPSPAAPAMSSAATPPPSPSPTGRKTTDWRGSTLEG